jgi:hypothetical protein
MARPAVARRVGQAPRLFLLLDPLPFHVPRCAGPAPHVMPPAARRGRELKTKQERSGSVVSEAARRHFRCGLRLSDAV